MAKNINDVSENLSDGQDLLIDKATSGGTLGKKSKVRRLSVVGV